jgi:hypothetical protein
MKDDKLWEREKAWAQVLGDGRMKWPYVKCVGKGMLLLVSNVQSHFIMNKRH